MKEKFDVVLEYVLCSIVFILFLSNAILLSFNVASWLSDFVSSPKSSCSFSCHCDSE